MRNKTKVKSFFQTPGLIFIAFLFLFVTTGFAEDTIITDNELEQPRQDSALRQLSVISDSVSNTEKALASLEDILRKTKDEDARNKLKTDKAKLLEKLDTLHSQLEAAVTGGVRITDYDKKDDKKPFDWQAEVLDIFKPMIAELKTLTERPRTIEKLRSEIASIEEQLPAAEKAVKQIGLIKTTSQDKSIEKQLSKIETNWIDRKQELTNQHKLLTFQLEEKLNPPDVKETSLSETLQIFFAGRGLTILLAALAFSLFFLSFSYLGRIIENQITKRKGSQAQLFSRALSIVVQILAILLSLFSAMLVLYVRGDWLILGFILLILLGVAWGLRQSAPKYIREVKLLLNMGAVREGERVVYNGLPWKVSSLNMYSTLINPALTGGSIKLPVDDVINLRSRIYSEEEGWFPSKSGDYVVLDDGVFGPVLKQTPEIVQMTVLGGSVKTYATTVFLGLNPRNISNGFGVFVTFGLDYNLQSDATNTIPRQFENSLKEAINVSSFSKNLKTFSVEFKAASDSSLDLLIISTFSGEAAGDYFAIDRFLQKTCVDICTQNNWSIPFNNVTVHLENAG